MVLNLGQVLFFLSFLLHLCSPIIDGGYFGVEVELLLEHKKNTALLNEVWVKAMTKHKNINKPILSHEPFVRDFLGLIHLESNIALLDYCSA